MNITGVIPARYASTRLPGKPLILIKGKPMIQRVYEQTMKSKLINRVIVATDDKRIIDCVLNFGGEAVLTSSKHESGTDRIYEAVKNIKCEIVVNIQGDEPFINPLNIDKAIQPLINDRSINVSTLAIRVKSIDELKDENKVKVVLDKNNFALYFSRNYIPYKMKNNPSGKFSLKENVYYRHIGLYVYRKKYLMHFAKLKKSFLEKTENLEQLRILENGEKIKVIQTSIDSVSIDTKQDLESIRRK